MVVPADVASVPKMKNITLAYVAIEHTIRLIANADRTRQDLVVSNHVSEHTIGKDQGLIFGSKDELAKLRTVHAPPFRYMASYA